MMIARESRNGPLSHLLIFAFYFACIALLTWRAGAFQNEFGADPDEPAHYVTGLMVHDYIAAGLPGTPLQYARDFYLHYPKVALGHWPPAFYLLQAAWTLVFTPSRLSLLLLMASIAAAVATVTYAVLRTRYSMPASFSAGLLLLSLPAFQAVSREIMTEALLTLLVLLSVAAYGSYLDCGRWHAAAWFGVWSAAAILAKGSAIQLALVPPFALLLTRRWVLVRRFSFWLPGLIVAGAAGPWYLFVPGAQHESVARFGSVLFIYPRLTESLTVWASFLGVALTLCTIAGLAVTIGGIVRGSAAGIAVAALAALWGAYTTRVFIGAFESRHLVACLPLLVVFATTGWEWLLDRFSSAGRRAVLGYAIGALGLATLVGLNLYNSPVKLHYGFSEAAQSLVAKSQFRNSVFLVCSGAAGEGMFISEIAMREARPGHVVLRGSKMLASIGWMGADYRLTFDDPDRQLSYLESIPVGVIVIDTEGRKTPHGRLLEQGLRAHPERWQPVPLDFGSRVPREPIEAYRLVGHEGRPIGRIRIPLRSGLFGDIEK